MKNRLLRSAASIVSLAVLLFSIACSPGAPTSNSGNAQPANAANVEPAKAAVDRDDPCDRETTDAKVEALNTKIDQRFKNDEKFRKQYEGQNGQPPSFMFRVVNNEGVIELRIKGKVSGKDKNGNSKLEGILDIIDGYLDKTSCIQKVRFIPGAITTATDLATTTEQGFEWIYCEHPQVSCPGGTCKDDPPGCTAPMATPPANANNSNVNTNRNRSTNGG